MLASEDGLRQALDFPIVGIGASDGGVSALQALLKALPHRTGLAFLVVQRLYHEHPSHLVELLEKLSALSVREAVGGTTVERDCVYVAAPGIVLTLEKGILRNYPQIHCMRAGIDTIDMLFVSLAAERGRQAIAVVLSGTGTDGAAGSISIKRAGGRVFVQDPTTALYDGMPRAVIATGAADQVLPVDFIYLETNTAIDRHAGQPMQGKRIKAFIPNLEQSWLDRYGHVATTGEAIRLEHLVEGLGNQWFEVSVFRMGGEGSRQVALLFVNIAQRKRDEEKLRISEAKFKTLVENSPDSISRFDRDHRHLFVNTAITRATGLLPEHFLGKSNEELGMPPELCRLWSEKIEEVFTSGHVTTMEFTFPAPEGMRHYSSLFVPELAADGSVQTLDEGAGDVPEGTRVILFQIVRELLFNTVKHAGVTNACLGLERSADQLCIVVQDHGVGFDPALVESRHAGNAGFGLFSTRERLASLGGHLDIKSSLGLGTHITVCVPVGQAAEESVHR